MGKTQPRKTIAILEPMSMPNQSRSTGAKAMRGVVYSAVIQGAI